MVGEEFWGCMGESIAKHRPSPQMKKPRQARLAGVDGGLMHLPSAWRREFDVPPAWKQEIAPVGLADLRITALSAHVGFENRRAKATPLANGNQGISSDRPWNFSIAPCRPISHGQKQVSERERWGAGDKRQKSGRTPQTRASAGAGARGLGVV